MESERRPKSDNRPSQDTVSVDEISKLLQAFEQRMEKKIASIQTTQPSSASRGPMICFYCHHEGHGTICCPELQKDKEDKLVEQKGNNFFLPNGALIPFDSSRPIRHVVASYQPARKSNYVSADLRVGCGALQPWYPPAISSQSFSGSYQSDPARRRHEEPKPYKAPSIPPSASR